MNGGELTDDLFYGGRLRLLQPRRGHRVGTDAALLAAAARDRAQGAVLADFGAGVGAVGLALAASGAAKAWLVEIDPALAALAAENAKRNGLDGCAAAIARPVEGLGLGRDAEEPAAETLDLVVANPPFDDAARFRASPDADRERAHAAGPELLDACLRAAVRLLKPGGSLVMIHRPEALGALVSAATGRFGDLRLRAVHATREAAAMRLLVAARKGRRGPLALLPPLVLHPAGGGFTAEADAAQRGETALAME